MGSTERVVQFIEYKGISKYKFCKDLGFSNKFLDNSSNMGTDKACIILHHYPEINADWLITGRGEMLNESNYKIQYWSDEKGNNIADEINKNEELFKPKTFNIDYKELAEARLEVIDGLKFKISTLENQINELRYSQKNPILYSSVAESARELMKKHDK